MSKIRKIVREEVAKVLIERNKNENRYSWSRWRVACASALQEAGFPRDIVFVVLNESITSNEDIGALYNGLESFHAEECNLTNLQPLAEHMFYTLINDLSNPLLGESYVTCDEITDQMYKDAANFLRLKL